MRQYLNYIDYVIETVRFFGALFGYAISAIPLVLALFAFKSFVRVTKGASARPAA